MLFTLTRDWEKRALGFLLFSIQPIVLQQMSVTMLDAPQAIMLLLHVFFIIKLADSSSYIRPFVYSIFSGVTLGLFMGTKIGFFVLPIILADLAFLYFKKKILWLLITGFASVATYVSLFIPYFTQGNTIMDFLRAEKWTLQFYLDSQAKPFILAPFTTWFIGLNRSWTNDHSWSFVEEWIVLWPFLGIIFLSIFHYFKKIDTVFQYFLLMTTLLFLSFMFVPFFSRYFLLIIPFIIFTTLKNEAVFNHKLFFLILAVALFQTVLYLFPGPKKTISTVQRHLQNSTYQDLYSYLTPESKKTLPNRSKWWEEKIKDERKVRILSKIITISPKGSYFVFNSKMLSDAKVRLTTEQGQITYSIPIEFNRINNKWLLSWNDKLVFPSLIPKSEIKINPPKCGKVVNSQGKILADCFARPVVYIIPSKIRNEDSMLEQVFSLTGLKKHDQEYFYKANNPPSIAARIAPVLTKIHENSIKHNDLDPGILLKEELMMGISPEITNTRDRQKIAQVVDINRWKLETFSFEKKQNETTIIMRD